MSAAMNFLGHWVRTPVADALGWTLVHSLWEGLVIAATLAMVLAGLRSALGRYAAACVALVAIVASFAVTLWQLWPETAGARSPLALDLPPVSSLVAVNAPAEPVSLRELLAIIAPWLAPIWIAGVFLFSLRSAAGWLRLSGMRQRGVCAAPAVWQQAVTWLAAELRVSRPVVLLESVLVETPMVLGHLRPMILVPLGFLAGLPSDQVEAILLHELAHIRRADYLINTFQRVVEGLLFYHPAAWWISRVIRTERENCCDDAVVDLRGNAHAYAEALTTLEQTRVEQRWPGGEAAVAATGGSLIKRIQRLLYPQSPSALSAPTIAAIVVIATTAMALVAWPAKEKQEGPVTAQTSAQGPWAKWLNEDVVYIIAPEEKAAFETLSTDEDRQKFVEQFWERRNPTPGSVENKVKEEHYRRIAYANAHWFENRPGWQTDRGRIYILYGPPDEIESHPHSDNSVKAPFEKWRYHYLEGFVDAARATHVNGNNIDLTFVERDGAWVQVDTLPANAAKSAVQQPVTASAAAQWLNEDVVYIISPEEKAAFESLATDDERQHFIEQFWQRRDPTPGTPENEFKEEHYRRIAYANKRWTASKPGWQTDRGRIYIQYGPPDEIESQPTGNNKIPSPYEEWFYHHIVGADGTIMPRTDLRVSPGKAGTDTYGAAEFTFVDKYGTKDYTLENTVLIGKQTKPE